MSRVDQAREALAEARTEVIRAEERLLNAQQDRDAAEDYLLRVEREDAENVLDKTADMRREDWFWG